MWAYNSAAMRREIFRSDPREALDLLARAPIVHLATTTPEGDPVLRALDAAVLDDGVYFHGSRSGEKARCLGRPAVVQAEELVAHLPSWMVHPAHACPATTLYRSVQVHGTLREVTEPARKAQALEALMRRWQPEGRYDPIDPSDPHYAGALNGVLIVAVPFERVDGKFKLGQNRRPEELSAILAGLWERGQPGDVEAIEAIRGANPTVPDPPFLAAEGFRLLARVPDEELPAVEALLEGEYWWTGQQRALIGPAHRGATAWVGARAPEGKLIASARAVCDGKTAWIYDVVVAAALRGRGLGKRLLALLIDHPALRRSPFVMLRTRDAQTLYAKFGFVDVQTQRRPYQSTYMALERKP
jgi:nitroimidazol reductase NimA-like FMN-containing flavoprotein (pyridoxamine 5'-phosphate oxidase superfamily)/ribosomal protein S18 acetylase RimI-like enzyme